MNYYANDTKNDFPRRPEGTGEGFKAKHDKKIVGKGLIGGNHTW